MVYGLDIFILIKLTRSVAGVNYAAPLEPLTAPTHISTHFRCITLTEAGSNPTSTDVSEKNP